jgi:hypothetical protein
MDPFLLENVIDGRKHPAAPISPVAGRKDCFDFSQFP